MGESALPPEDFRRIRTLDAHAEGEPLRVILDGFPQPSGATVTARRRDAMRRLDGLRRALMWEPRGHADMYGCLVMPAVEPGSDFAVLFLHNEGYSTMCGHGIIAVSVVALEAGLVPVGGERAELVIDTPAGTVRADVSRRDGRARQVRFRNVPSFALGLDERVEVPGLGEVRYDLAFGGAFYAYVDADEIDLELDPGSADRIVAAGRAIRKAVARARPVDHPGSPDLGFLYGTIFTGPARAPGRHSRHACVFADGELDRSPTGTGVSGRLALLRARKALDLDETIEVESLIGSRFSGRIHAETRVGTFRAVIPEIGGRAWLTGRHEFWIDPDDPWGEGFLLR